MARNRILCPFHEESTPSCVIYPDETFKCYGCGENGNISKLPGSEYIQVPKGGITPNIDLEAEIEAIRKLPIANVRGLNLPVDATGYYIVWQGGIYYKKRFYDDSGSRYLNPKGISQPLLVVEPRPVCEKQGLVVVEGELNALSLKEALMPTSWEIVSPGAASNFGEKHLTFYKEYSRVKIFVDQDAAGAIAAIELKSRLVQHIPTVDVFLLERDFNDRLVKDGKEKLKEYAVNELGLP